MEPEPPGKLSAIQLGVRPAPVPLFNFTEEEIDYVIEKVDELDGERNKKSSKSSDYTIRYQINRVNEISASAENKYKAFEELCLTLYNQGVERSIENHIVEMLEDKADVDPYQEDESDESDEDEVSKHPIEVVDQSGKEDSGLDFEMQMYQLATSEGDDSEFAEILDYYTTDKSVKFRLLLPNDDVGEVEYDIPDSQDDPFVEFVDSAVVKDSDGELIDVTLKQIERLRSAIVPVNNMGGEWFVAIGGENQNIGLDIAVSTGIEDDFQ